MYQGIFLITIKDFKVILFDLLVEKISYVPLS